MNEPFGDICVLLNDDHKMWTVSLCRGNGRRDQLGTFRTREEATEYAISERDRRWKEDQFALDIHFPDDCPCLGERASGQRTGGKTQG